MNSLTTQDLRNIMAKLSKIAMPVHSVESIGQAHSMTANDPVGHVWTMDEKYYESEPVRRVGR